MSIHVNWGAPGSYKTSHALLEAIRVILGTTRFFVTNVRGLNLNLIWERFGKNYPNYVHPVRTDRFFNVTTEFLDPQECNEILKYFPLWLPFGTYFLFDEVQLVYPKAFPVKQFNSYFSELDIPEVVWQLRDRFDKFTQELVDENIETIKSAFISEFAMEPNAVDFPGKFANYLDTVVYTRPTSLLESFSKHRHYGWDFSFTCQDLSQFSPAVYNVCESAHYQQNMAVKFAGMGKWRYRRFFHSTERTSPHPRDTGTFHRLDKRILGCYLSTQIGQNADTLANQNPFLTFSFIKLYFLIFLLILCIYYLSSNYEKMPFFTHETQSTSMPANNAITSQTISTNFPNATSIPPAHSAPIPTSSSGPALNIKTSKSSTSTFLSSTNSVVVDDSQVIDDFSREDVSVYISGYVRYKRHYRYAGQLHYADGSISSFEDLPPPYYAIPYSRCYYALYRMERLIRYIHCPPPPIINSQNSQLLKNFPSLIVDNQ